MSVFIERHKVWNELDQDWDILIIGGGITGAGIFLLAVNEGYKTLLVEGCDFASGTSSRSSKLIHGGFRYLRNRQFHVTRESVRERERWLKEARHLITPLGFLMPCPEDAKLARQYGFGVVLYDLLAPKWQHARLSREKLLQLCPPLRSEHLQSGYLYYDAVMDDSAVVFRLLREATIKGGTALNYTLATRLLRDPIGDIAGAVIEDQSDLRLGSQKIRARVVINATGPWSDELRSQVGAPARMRKLRGSHLVFPRERVNLSQAVTLLHPRDHRAMFAIPWEGVTLIGTTDLDHSLPLSREPFTTQAEIDYILEAANSTFPSLNLTQPDILSTFSGLRPIIHGGQSDPSKESRAHQVWQEQGLITITGGKYTTFRLMAETALRQALPRLPHPFDLSKKRSYFSALSETSTPAGISSSQYLYLSGRYGSETDELLASAPPEENKAIHNLPNLWSELRWAARNGAVEHLDDLLLRRVRLGLLLPDGARAEMEPIRQIVQPELQWNDQRWQMELSRYYQIYQQAYSPSPAGFDIEEKR